MKIPWSGDMCGPENGMGVHESPLNALQEQTLDTRIVQ